MKVSRLLQISGIASMFLVAATVYAGGWAVVTIQDLPDYFVAGKSSSLVFKIRQHGVTLSDGMAASLTLSNDGGITAKAVVSPTGQPGEYKAIFTVPKAGDWTVEVDSGLFGTSKLLPIKAIPSGSPEPAPLADVTQGKRLFVAKGCITCHTNDAVGVKSLTSVGPDLTGKKYPTEYLKSLLADPKAALKKDSESWVEMPNLNLSKKEIGAIASFIHRG